MAKQYTEEFKHHVRNNYFTGTFNYCNRPVMQKPIILAILLSLFATIAQAQVEDIKLQSAIDTIQIKKTFNGYQFYKEEEPLKLKQLEDILKTNEQAYKEIRSSRSSRTISTILGYAGGFLIGWPLGTAIAGGTPNWAMAGVGAGLVVIAIPISSSSNKKVKKAVLTYNANLR